MDGKGAVHGVLLDLDGVLYVGDEAVPGAADTVAWLREQDIPHLFLTNTSSQPRAAVVAKLDGFGVETRADQVLTPATAAADWLRESAGGRAAACWGCGRIAIRLGCRKVAGRSPTYTRRATGRRTSRTR
jgi:ribonucleotide monophosphatase NagD (HAD superfamily)